MVERTTIETIVSNEPSTNYSGFFVELMTSFNRYISEEYKANRLTGSQYAEVYLGGMQANLQAALAYAQHQDAVNNEEAQLAQQDELKRLELSHQDTWKDLDIALQDRQLAQQSTLELANQALTRLLKEAELAMQDTWKTKDLAHQAAVLAMQNTWKQAELALQGDKLALESSLNVANIALTAAQTQAFKAKHNKDMAKLVFDVVTIGVTQEQMSILAGPNSIFGSITPATTFNAAQWVG